MEPCVLCGGRTQMRRVAGRRIMEALIRSGEIGLHTSWKIYDKYKSVSDSQKKYRVCTGCRRKHGMGGFK